MRNKKLTMLFGLLIVVLIVIFRNWFMPTYLSSGDWIYYYPSLIKQTSFLSAWDIRNIGMGGSMLPTLWLEAYTVGTMKLSFGIGWLLYERIFWFFPYLLCGFVTLYWMYKRFLFGRYAGLLSVFLFLGNTYALMLVGGGQMGIALAYVFAGFCLIACDSFLKRLSYKNAMVLGVSFGILTMLDIRVTYMMLLVLSLYLLFSFSYIQKKLIRFLYLLFVAGIIVIGLHMFWLLPTLLSHGSAFQQFSSVYTSESAVRFFSFANFENTISLLHPNWPDNIFGKVGFMRPEFVGIPVLAYSALFFLKKPKSKKDTYINKMILYFSMLGLLGAFLAKGTQDPFGQVYIWLFIHFPGFILFRDPTKWYLLIAMSYAMLIPFSVEKIFMYLKGKLS